MRRNLSTPGVRRARRTAAFLVTLALAAAISGCQGGASGSARPEHTEAERVALALLAEGRPADAAYEYLRLAGEAGPEQARRYRLLAVEALLDAGDVASATRVLDQDLAGDLPQPDAYQRDVARAEIALLGGDAAGALEQLAVTPPPNLPPAVATRAAQVRARALARVGNNLEAARALLALEPTLGSPAAIARNRADAWKALTRVSLPALERARVAPPNVFGGWIDLAIVFSRTFMDTQSFATQLAAWQGRYPGHPANESLVPELARASAEQGRAPTRVALLLPVDGPFAPAAQAVRDGFMAAWYTDDPGTRPAVEVLDSSADDVWPAYRRALESGAEFVVGPLRRPLVATLAAEPSLAVPTLALNHASESEPTPQTTIQGPATEASATPGAVAAATAAAPVTSSIDRAPTEGLFQFALSPEDEARQVAERAWFDGHARAAMIAPQGNWGERVSGAFAGAWEALGGEVVGQVAYDAEAVDLSAPVSALLGVDASEERYKELRRVVGSGLKGEARRRQDLDFVFMAGFPNQARKVRPQFKFHHATDVPVYSTSHVFSGVADPGADRDIDGVMFGDMPWALGLDPSDTDLRRRVETLWPNSVASYMRLYAFGADAYALVARVGRLRSQAQAEYQGATGRLSVTAGNKIRRRLTWGRFEDGRPALVDAAVVTTGATDTTPGQPAAARPTVLQSGTAQSGTAQPGTAQPGTAQQPGVIQP